MEIKLEEQQVLLKALERRIEENTAQITILLYYLLEQTNKLTPVFGARFL